MARSDCRRILLLFLSICVSVRVSGLCQVCYNGDLDDSGACDCYPGWTGQSCQYCTGRIRLNGTSGSVVSQFGPQYTDNLKCMWFIEAEEPETDINIRFEVLDTECGWDYLHVYQGDSVLSAKMASFNGDVVSPDLREETPVTSNDTNSTNPPVALPFLCTSVPEYESHSPLDFTLSGSAVLYFYTDAGAVGKGFNLTYWTDCAHNCSGNGACNSDGACVCASGWAVPLCDELERVCPNNCSTPQGSCDIALAVCVCVEPFTGVDCSINGNDIHWKTMDGVISPLVHLINESDTSEVDLEFEVGQLQRAGHSAVVWGGFLWVFGGYTFPLGKNNSEMDLEPLLWRYHLETHIWEAFISLDPAVAPHLNSSETANMSMSLDDNVTVAMEDVPMVTRPSARYGHSAVVYEGVMYVFGGELISGGAVSNELWSLNLTSFQWQLVLPSNSTTSPLLPVAVRHHTAHVVGDRMVIIWGFAGNRASIPTSLVQQYEFVSGQWSVAQQSGVSVAGTFAHTSVYSEGTGLVYVFGGVGPDSTSQSVIRAEHYLYNTTSGEWSKLPSSRQPVFHHSAVLVGSSVVVFGGRRGNKCFTDAVIIYDTVCHVWHTPSSSLPGLPLLQGTRYAHTSVRTTTPEGDSVLMFGGYNSLLFGDLLELQLPNCSAATSKASCLSNTSLGLCAWSTADSTCIRAGLGGEHSCEDDPCSAYDTCSSCAQNGCQWLSNVTDLRCISIVAMANNSDDRIVNSTKCPEVIVDEGCSRYGSVCEDCLVDSCTYSNRCNSPSNESAIVGSEDLSSCRTMPCSQYSTCSSCKANRDCLWCPSEQRCVTSALYPESFPFGQCLGWISNSYSCPEANCSAYRDCSDCTADERCGWCSDISDTGLGVCSEGGFNGDLKGQCLVELWYFNECPLCQCSGHSECENGTICVDCNDNTTGLNCEYCSNQLFGDPRNGGMCEPCFCNDYAVTCENRTGQCTCNTRGVTGLQCDRCESGYSGTAVDEFCAFPLSYAFQQSFNITQQNAIFFVIPPNNGQVVFTAQLSGTISGSATLTLAFGQRNSGLLNRTGAGLEVLSQTVMGSSRSQVSLTVQDGNFGNGDNALLVAFTDVRPSFFVTLTFQDPVTDPLLVAFLVFTSTFVVCLSVMLICMSVSWFGFRWYDRRRRARRRRREMRRRVARPYATVQCQVHEKPGIEEPQQVGYVGVEPLVENKAAIVSVLVQLPGNMENGRPRQGQTGVCFGSALVRIKTKPTATGGNKKGIFKRKRNGHPSSSANGGESNSIARQARGEEASTDV